jgi:hypothetical protein
MPPIGPKPVNPPRPVSPAGVPMQPVDLLLVGYPVGVPWMASGSPPRQILWRICLQPCLPTKGQAYQLATEAATDG